MSNPRWKITFERTPTSWTVRVGLWWMCLIVLAVVAWLVFG